MLPRMGVRGATGLAPQLLLPEAMFGKTYTKLRLNAISRLLAGETRFAKFLPLKKQNSDLVPKDRWLYWRLHTGWGTLASQS